MHSKYNTYKLMEIFLFISTLRHSSDIKYSDNEYRGD